MWFCNVRAFLMVKSYFHIATFGLRFEIDVPEVSTWFILVYTQT